MYGASLTRLIAIMCPVMPSTACLTASRPQASASSESTFDVKKENALCGRDNSIALTEIPKRELMSFPKSLAAPPSCL